MTAQASGIDYRAGVRCCARLDVTSFCAMHFAPTDWALISRGEATQRLYALARGP